MPMSSSAALEYAASWGSYMTAGDPGACMYGFGDYFVLQSEQHRADCLAYMQDCRKIVQERPGDYEEGELSQLDEFVETLQKAKTLEDKMWIVSTHGDINVEMTVAQILDIPASGAADSAVAALREIPEIAEQLATIDPVSLRDEMREYGAWDDEELADHDANLDRFLWLGASDVRDNELDL